jgi:hypothetical protein
VSVTERAWKTLPDPAKNAAKAVWSGYARLTNRGRMLPGFLIIGTQRGGTTSLYKYLMQHPNLAHALTKELRFFDVNYHRGLGWYRSRFPSRRYRDMVRHRRGIDLIVGEASPDYLFYPHAPARVARDLPDVKLIVLLRNPVDRAFSHYWHQFKRGHETLSFAEAVEAEPRRLEGELERIVADPGYSSYEWHHHSYVTRGRYQGQLARWMDLFPRDRFLIERSEDFFQDPKGVFGRVLEFLELPHHDLTDYETFNAFSSGRMDPDLRARLVEDLRPDNRRLYEELGQDFGWDT